MTENPRKERDTEKGPKCYIYILPKSLADFWVWHAFGKHQTSQLIKWLNKNFNWWQPRRRQSLDTVWAQPDKTNKQTNEWTKINILQTDKIEPRDYRYHLQCPGYNSKLLGIWRTGKTCPIFTRKCDTDVRISWQFLKAVSINILKDTNENMLIMKVQTICIIGETITKKRTNVTSITEK